ncbi:MAG: hypothetical protein FWH01_13625 [Oscillospiraceae bacterium]|nr:hypothetical protein [Oscillospiraceae bacterium]
MESAKIGAMGIGQWIVRADVESARTGKRITMVDMQSTGRICNPPDGYAIHRADVESAPTGKRMTMVNIKSDHIKYEKSISIYKI